MKMARLSSLVLAAALLVLLVLPVFAQEEASGDAVTLELTFINGVYENLDDGGMAPVRRGGMTIYLSSPQNRLEVHGSRLRLVPLEDEDALRAELTVDFEGAGDLVARLEGLGTSQTFEDHIEAPRQSVNVPGLIRLARLEAGYEVEIVALPPSVDLEVQSGVADRLVGACQVFEKIPFLRISCDGLSESLAKVTVPLPGPGRRFLIPGANLSDVEKAYFERFVGER